jgi:hypothetical protein
VNQRHQLAILVGAEAEMMPRLGAVAGDREALIARGDELDRAVQPACRDSDQRAPLGQRSA